MCKGSARVTDSTTIHTFVAHTIIPIPAWVLLRAGILRGVPSFVSSAIEGG